MDLKIMLLANWYADDPSNETEVLNEIWKEIWYLFLKIRLLIKHQ